MRSRREILKVARQEKQRRRAKKGIVILIIFLVFLVGGLITLNLSNFRLSRLVIKGNSLVKNEEIEKTAREVLAGRYYLIIPRDSFLFYPEQEIVDRLRTDLPAISSVEIDRADRETLNISISERESKVLYCRRGVAGEKECYFTDRQGLVYAPAPIFSDAVYLEIYGSGSSTPLNTRPIPPAEFAQLITTVRSLPPLLDKLWQDEVAISSAEVLNSGDYLLRLRGAKSGNWKMLVNGRQAPEDLLANLTAVLGSETFAKQLSVLQANLDYLDLRFGKKVFYKFKQ